MRTIRVILMAILLSQLRVGEIRAQYIWVNQAGYLPDQETLAYTVDAADSFYVIDNVNGNIAFRGAPKLTSTKDPSTGWTTYVCDFSSLDREGKYRIATDTPDTSYSFVISYAALTDVYKKSLKGFYFQRCGTALLPKYAGVYASVVSPTLLYIWRL